MMLKIGIVGLPNVGKSTLFNALLKKQVALSANYPFATIEPNIGIVEVPDKRLEKLGKLVKQEFHNPNSNREIPERIVPAVVEFVDIAGLVKGASSGQGLGNKFLSHIREVHAIAHVVRDFEDPNIIKEGSVSPKSDIEVIETELALADMEVVSKRIERVKNDLKKGKNDELTEELENLEKIQARLDSLNFLGPWDSGEVETAQKYSLLSYKPKIKVFNIDEDKISTIQVSDSKDIIYLSAKLESELSMLDSETAKELMQEYGINISGLDQLIQRAYDILGLQSYFTAGPKEVRAWTIKKGWSAPEAAGVIHTDFEKGFISADIVSFQDLIQAGSYKNAKGLGKLRNEGRDYIMQDGDVVEFKFNV